MLNSPECLLLTLEDLDQVIELESSLFPSPWKKEEYIKLLQAGICYLFGLKQNNKLIAYATVAILKNIAELDVYNIAVAKQKQNQGLGKFLLTSVLEIAQKAGINRAILEVRETNYAAIAVYENLGFTVCGKRNNYYSDPPEDAILYEKSL